MEGYLKKKSMVVMWSSHVTVVLPKMYKYIMRYFFINGNELCYTKTKKEHDTHKSHKTLVDLTKVIALHVFPSKMEVVEESGKHIVLKTTKEEIKRWVPALAARLPKVDSIVGHVEGECINDMVHDLVIQETRESGSHNTRDGAHNTRDGSHNTRDGTTRDSRDLSPRHPSMPASSSSSPMPPRMVNPAFPLFPLTSSATDPSYPSTPPPHYPSYPSYPATPPAGYSAFYASPAMIRKLPSFRTTSSLSFTLTSKQCASWLGAMEDNPDGSNISSNNSNNNANSGNNSGNSTLRLNRSSYGLASYGPSSPVQNMGWDEWDAIFSRFQRNEEVY